MDKDSKLIFESYKRKVLNEQASTVLNPAAVTAGQAGGAAVLGGLMVTLDNISKWAYSFTDQGQKAEIVNLVQPKIDDYKKATTLLDNASKNPSDIKIVFQSLDYSLNVLLSYNESKEIAQIISKINDLTKNFYQSQDLDTSLLVNYLTQLNTALDNTYRDFVNKVTPQLGKNGQKLIDYVTKLFSQTKSEISAFAEWAKSGSLYVPKSSELAPTAAAGAPMPPEDEEDKKSRKEYEKEMRDLGKEAAKTRVEKERIDLQRSQEQLKQLKQSGELSQKLGSQQLLTARTEYVTSNSKLIKSVIGLVLLLGIITAVATWFAKRGPGGVASDITSFIGSMIYGAIWGTEEDTTDSSTRTPSRVPSGGRTRTPRTE